MMNWLPTSTELAPFSTIAVVQLIHERWQQAEVMAEDSPSKQSINRNFIVLVSIFSHSRESDPCTCHLFQNFTSYGVDAPKKVEVEVEVEWKACLERATLLRLTKLTLLFYWAQLLYFNCYFSSATSHLQTKAAYKT